MTIARKSRATPEHYQEVSRSGADVMNVVMLIENCSYPRDVRVRREAETLVGAGMRVSIICPALKGQPRRETVKGVKVYRYTAPREGRGKSAYVWEYGYSMLVALYLAIRIAIADGIDVIHAANPPDLFVFVAMLFKPFGVKFVYDQHDLVPEMYRARYSGGGKSIVDRVLSFCERCSYKLADHVVVTNASYRETAMLRGKVPSNRISIVRNGPDAAQLESRAEARAGLCEPGTTLIAYLGLMGVQDGVVHLIRAVNHLVCDLGRKDVRFLLLGSGEEEQNLAALTRTLGLEPYVRFMGFIPDPEYLPYLLAADVCVDPDPSSEYNDRSTMIKIMDYMAASKPIVAFDLAETRRSAGKAALYVEPNDELKFAKALAYLMDHPEQRAEMGAFGRNKVITELSWSVSADCLLRAYDALVPVSKGISEKKAMPSAGLASSSMAAPGSEIKLKKVRQ